MATTPFVKAERLQKLPPYLFAEIDKKKKAAIAAGRDVINLGVGDPDKPTPSPIIKSLQENVENPSFHQYALDQGAPELRQSIAAFCKKRYGIDLDPGSEILPLDRLEGRDRPLPARRAQPRRHQPRARPVLSRSIGAAASSPAPMFITMPLEASLGFRPDLDAIPLDVYNQGPPPVSSISPTTRPAGQPTSPYFEKVVDLAKSPQPGDRPGRGLQRDVLRQAPPPASSRSRAPRTTPSSSTACRRPST